MVDEMDAKRTRVSGNLIAEIYLCHETGDVSLRPKQVT